MNILKGHICICFFLLQSYFAMGQYSFSLSGISHPSACQISDGGITFATNLPDGTYTVQYNIEGISWHRSQDVTVANGIFFLGGEFSPGKYYDFILEYGSTYIYYMEEVTLVMPTEGPLISVIGHQDALACGTNTGSITLSVAVPDGYYSVAYKWNDTDASYYGQVVSGQLLISERSAGTYQDFHLSDCSSAGIVAPVTLTEPAASLEVVAFENPALCEYSWGSITFHTDIPDHLLQRYTLRYYENGVLSGGAASEPIPGGFKISVSPGVYSNFSLSVVTFDGSGTPVFQQCASFEGSVTIRKPYTKLLATAVNQPSTCSGTGSVAFETDLPDGAYANLFYLRNGIQQLHTEFVQVTSGTALVEGLEAGHYSSFWIEHIGTGCRVTYDTPITLAGPGSYQMALQTVNQPQYCGGSGSIVFSTNLPDGNYVLAYNRVSGSAYGANVTVNSGSFTFEKLEPDTYSNFMIDFNGCAILNNGVATVVASQVPASLVPVTVNQAECSDGSIVFSTNLPDGLAFDLWFDYTQNSGFNPSSGSSRMNEVEVNSGTFTLNLSQAIYSNFRFAGCQVSYNESINLIRYSLNITGWQNPGGVETQDGLINFSTSLPEGNYGFYYSRGLENGLYEPVTTSIYVTAGGTFTLTGLSINSGFGNRNYKDFRVYNTSLGLCTAVNETIVRLERPAGSYFLELQSTFTPSSCGGNDGRLLFVTNVPLGDYTLTYRKNGAEVTTVVTVVAHDGSNAPGAFFLESLSRGRYSDLRIGNLASFGNIEPIGLSDPGLQLNVATSVDPFCEFDFPANHHVVWDGGITFRHDLPAGVYTLNYKKDGQDRSTEFTPLRNLFGDPIDFGIGGGFDQGFGPGVYSDFTASYSGCMVYLGTVVTLNQPPSYFISVTNRVHPTNCSSNNGSVEFETNLPTGQYEFHYKVDGIWKSSSAMLAPGGKITLTGLAGGAYSSFYTSSDGRGCLESGTFDLVPEQGGFSFALNSVVQPAPCRWLDGRINFSSNLPEGSYWLSYKFNGSNRTSAINAGANGAFSLLYPDEGTYTDFAVTNYGCTNTLLTQVEITGQAESAPTLSGTDPSVCGGNDGRITLGTNVRPELIYGVTFKKDGEAVEINSAVFYDNKFEVSGLTAGVYTDFRILSSNELCSASSTLTITLDDPLGSISEAGLAEHLSSKTLILTSGESSVATDDCKVIVAVTAGTVSGSTITRVYVEETVQTFNSKPYVQRHYDISPATNGSARVTLYFSQAEFTQYNQHPGSTDNLPTSPEDNIGKSNLRVSKFAGTTGNIHTGRPDTYSSTPTLINPDDTDIVWNGNFWEVSFEVTGFSGFFVMAAENGVLPVRLTSFTTEKEESAAKLTWETTSEANSDHFAVEHSMDARKWDLIGVLNAAGESSDVKSYGFIHSAPPVGLNYYRLKMVDRDGSVEHSPIRSLDFKSLAGFFVYPNPSADRIFINRERLGRAVLLQIYSAEGKQMLSTSDLKSGVSIKKLAAGVYTVRMLTNDGAEVSSKLVVHR